MRKFLKKQFKSGKGFTLVELLAVLVILGLVVAIAIPAIGSVIEKAEADADDAQEQMIIEAARIYEIQNKEASFPVTVDDLIRNGYLDRRQGDQEDLPKGEVVYGSGEATDDHKTLIFVADQGSDNGEGGE